jgi:Flp pilus assembly protein TadD
VQALEVDSPSDAEVLGAMGVVLLTAGHDPRRARPWLEAALGLAPEEPGLHYHLALAYSRSGDLALAREEVAEALRSKAAFDEEGDARRLAREIGAPSPPQSPR